MIFSNGNDGSTVDAQGRIYATGGNGVQVVGTDGKLLGEISSPLGLITVAFKFVPFQLGVGEAGTGLVTQLLGLGAAPGVTVSIVRKARMAIWSLVGTALLVRRGLTPP